MTGPVAPADLDRPDVVAEVRAVFERYERALVTNEVEVLDALFDPSAATVRYGAGENLRGIDAIRAFRAGRSPVGLARTLEHTVIRTFGDAFATAMTEFRRDGQATVGRQSQTWVKFADGGWRVVAAHVSVIPA